MRLRKRPTRPEWRPLYAAHAERVESWARFLSEGPALATSFVQPRDDLEASIANVWGDVLGIADIGIDDNFFDLGGNSLSALQVLAKLKKALHLQLPVVALFEAPTISALVSYLLPACLPAPQTQQHLLAQRRQQAQQASGQQDIAIIGMSGRFPGASCLSQFWHNLRSGVESITFFSDDELLAAGVDPALVADPHYVKARPILPDIDRFDAAFFGYSPREAALTDPQQRLFLDR